MKIKLPDNVLPFPDSSAASPGKRFAQDNYPDLPDSARKLDRQLRLAISEKRLLKIVYGENSRIVEPHDYGIKNGGRKLLAYQISGGSSTQRRSSRGWKILNLEKIETCMVMEKTFAGNRELPNQQHTSWDELFIRVV